MELVLVVVALVAGALLPVQAGTNAMMRTYAGRPEWATLVNFAVGLVAVVAWIVATRAPWPAAASLGRAPWWSWTGGVLGAFYVTAVVMATPRLGVATTLALAIAGQMIGALVIDQFGALGVAVRTLTPARVTGALLLVAGVVLIRR